MDINNTYYDNDEATRFEGSVDANATDGNGQDTVYGKETGSGNGVWRKVAIGGATGLVLGVGVSTLSAATPNATADVNETGDDADEAPSTAGETAATAVGDAAVVANAAAAGGVAEIAEEASSNSHNAIVDSDMSLATNVRDDMSFSQAFASARAEVGSGGAFEWHGNIYSTYYAEEWDGMSAAAKAEYNSHFAWNNSGTSHDPHGDITSTGNPTGTTDVDEHVPEVQVLGVVHDDEYNMNIGGVNIDGQDVILADIDNDQTFDIAASDLNHNGQLDYGEVVDISHAGITTGDVGGFINDYDDFSADDGEGSDYAGDGYNVEA